MLGHRSYRHQLSLLTLYAFDLHFTCLGLNSLAFLPKLFHPLLLFFSFLLTLSEELVLCDLSERFRGMACVPLLDNSFAGNNFQVLFLFVEADLCWSDYRSLITVKQLSHHLELWVALLIVIRRIRTGVVRKRADIFRVQVRGNRL